MSRQLQELVASRKQAGAMRGIYSVCSAHPWVLRAAVRQAKQDAMPLLIEATSNQVNQQGGYTGMQPKDFRVLVEDIAAEEGFPSDQLILGGDHLGPNPWQSLPVAEAMPLALEMMRSYAAAGFTKLHLDASMTCADDTAPLSDETIAERAAQLCAAAEAAATGERPVYIIGTEVPVPGGATESLSHLEVTAKAAAEKTLHVHREIFYKHGLGGVWPRVLGMVVQPGVEFNHDSVVDYIPERARSLVSLLEQHPGLVFEAHSTDYQNPQGFEDLVRDGFAILKVGPALTFAMREALFSLETIERELVEEPKRSNLAGTLESVMVREPANWARHYHGDPAEQRRLRRYSYSDRMRYYWHFAEAQAAVTTLMGNLRQTAVPETLVSAWMPEEHHAVRAGAIAPDPLEMVLHRIRTALRPYAKACLPV
ncbi:D-tagatose-bisphosphate aldolase, class II, non-catalytic subunit [Terriglobus tenax]|uniref:D-tagatose-bisphosphate aldolase, class II, non-catalytic subunit n=1 Tax=Terriglobus tenax TaxID=1111115 RepID=UPI0021E0FA4C|nr:D-tagatose-bisphosphate aldolase, class II, non-catalytic subunit [Terriglobus tenax]